MASPFNQYSTFYGQGQPADAGAGREKLPGQVFMPGKRKRINGLALALNILLPPASFAAIFYAMAFQVRYDMPKVAWSTVALGVLATALVYLQAKRSKQLDWEPMWYNFFSFTLGIAVALAAMGGDYVFKSTMEGALDFKNLNSYPAVDPSRQKGQQLMDAGRVYFASGTRLDLSKSMGFQNFDEYCVAPIVSGEGQLASYDYWAVGINCCDDATKGFRCGEWNNPHARSGLRYLDEGKRQYFRLAVEQAEAEFGVKATHPLFFIWTQDPVAVVSGQVDAAWKLFKIGVLTHFFTNLFLVSVALLTFSKLGHYHQEW